jgi:T-complex protein 1 subunit theta
MGDATNLVLILGGELLKKAENLLVMGLHPSEVIKGYELASAKAQAELESTLSFLSFYLTPPHALATILKFIVISILLATHTLPRRNLG